MAKVYPCIESVFCYYDSARGIRVRVWRDEQVVQDEYDNRDLDAFVRGQFPTIGFPTLGKADLARELAKFDRVNAVEVVDSRQQGLVIYTEWP